MKPINCATMEIGDKAATRDGREAVLIHVLDATLGCRWVFSMANEYVSQVFEHGNFYSDKSLSCHDLFQMPTTVDFYVNFYNHGGLSAHKTKRGAEIYSDKDECIARAQKFTFTGAGHD